MSLRTRTTLGLVAAMAATVVVAAPAAAKSALHCGQTITASTKLTHDLVGCPGTGLVVGADNITIDLNGHSIRGVNAPGSIGIADDGHAGLTVKHGAIADFFVDGVRLHDAAHSVVRDLRIVRIGAGGAEPVTSAGVLIDGSAGVKVTGSFISNAVQAFQSDGIDILGSPGAVIRGNRVVRNNWNGVVAIESPHSQLVRNVLDGNGNQGLEVNAGSDAIVVARNIARGNAQSGLVVGAVHGARIVDNRLSGNNGAGQFSFDLIDSLIAGNVSRDNGEGIELAGGQFGSHGNRILRNRADGNVDVGILLEDNANANRVSGNSATGGRDPRGAGILVFASTGNVIDGNDTDRNAGDGIGIFEETPGTAAGNTISRNSAKRNGGHGIESAVGGTIDGGGNKARANGTPPDCVGVVCS